MNPEVKLVDPIQNYYFITKPIVRSKGIGANIFWLISNLD